MDNYSIKSYIIESPISCRYTVFINTKKSNNDTILYYFHGRGGDDKSWLNAGRNIIRDWERTSRKIPIVVGISFGPRWVLIPKNRSDKSGYLEYFINTVKPHIEQNVNAAIKNRYIFGVSMGGHNAAQVVFRYPELFRKAAIVSPTIYPFSIHSKDEIINRFISNVRENVSDFRFLIKYYIFKKDTIKNNIYAIINSQREHTPDEAAWKKTNIIDNMKKPTGNTIPSIYVSCGDTDENGFYYGSSDLARKALDLSYPVKFRILKGGHMIMDEEEIADFLITE